jgi:hypothetical protein
LVKIVCKNVKSLLQMFSGMYPVKGRIRHWILIDLENQRALIQPSVSTGLNSYYIENLGNDDEKTLKEFAKSNNIRLFECPTIEFDDNRDPFAAR